MLDATIPLDRPAPVPSEPLLIDLQEVARLLSVSPRFAAKLHSTGRLPLGLKYGRARRFILSEIREYVSGGYTSRAAWEARSRKNATA